MSTKHFRTVGDFSRFRRDIELVCGCGHTAVLPFRPVVARFVAMGWPKDLGAAARRFRCSCCGGRPVRVGPIER